MIWSLSLPRHRKAKVWLDEPPGATYVPTKFNHRVVSNGSTLPGPIRLAAVEWMVPRGATASYGLLGAEYLDGDRDEGEVSVAVNRAGAPMLHPLAPDSEDVRVGLPDEYAEAVLSGLERVVTEGWQFRGQVTFRWAAHGAVGSSPDFFSELAAVVARLLAIKNVPSEDELISMLA